MLGHVAQPDARAGGRRLPRRRARLARIRQVGQAGRARCIPRRGARPRRGAPHRSARRRTVARGGPRLGRRRGLVLCHVAPGAARSALHPECSSPVPDQARRQDAAPDPAGPARPALPDPVVAGSAAPHGRLRPAAPAVPLRPTAARRLQRRGHRADRVRRPRARRAHGDGRLLPRDAAAADTHPLEADLATGPGHLGREGPDRDWVPDLRFAPIPEASHWVQADAPEKVNALLLDFFRESKPR